MTARQWSGTAPDMESSDDGGVHADHSNPTIAIVPPLPPHLGRTRLCAENISDYLVTCQHFNTAIHPRIP